MGNKVARALTSDGCLLGVVLAVGFAVAPAAQLVKFVGLAAVDISSALNDETEQSELAADGDVIEHLTDLTAYTGGVMFAAGVVALVALLVSPAKKPRTATAVRTILVLLCLAGCGLEIAFWRLTDDPPPAFYWFIDAGPIAVAAVAAALALSRKRPRPSPA